MFGRGVGLTVCAFVIHDGWRRPMKALTVEFDEATCDVAGTEDAGRPDGCGGMIERRVVARAGAMRAKGYLETSRQTDQHVVVLGWRG